MSGATGAGRSQAGTESGQRGASAESSKPPQQEASGSASSKGQGGTVTDTREHDSAQGGEQGAYESAPASGAGPLPPAPPAAAPQPTSPHHPPQAYAPPGGGGTGGGGTATRTRSGRRTEQATRRSRTGARTVPRTRKARLRVAKADPWSVMKVSFLLSIALGLCTIVAVAVLWMVLDAMGVFSTVGATLAEATGSEGSTGFDLESFLSLPRVLLFTAVIAVIDVVLATALATLGAFIYNLSAGFVGGVEVTLAEDE
ncbi:DUF3566 domain-containing protein [Streptomyces sp. A7024]|uniref:DUF3566 domain-containing protein n=1 Tax=Streptomyces coryli TaxID=1128680 RepID=A0A6G4TWL4_9ACTN|nr:DUF3566 domain-containing protein [Streptomyces coryli]